VARLNGEQIAQLQDAILGAFTPDDLEQFLLTRLDRYLSHISMGGNLRTTVFDVITQAQREGWTPDLLHAVAAERPGLPDLQALVIALLAALENRSPSPPDRRAPPVAGPAVLNELRDALVAAYDDLPRARAVVGVAGIVRGTLPASTLPMRDWWWEAIQTLQLQGKLLALVDAAIADPTVAALKPRFAQLRAQVWTPEPRDTGSLGTALSPAERASLEYQLAEKRKNLLLIEERISEFVESSDIPLQLVKSKRQTEAHIAEMEARLGSAPGA
jgi:hypothetical protein